MDEKQKRYWSNCQYRMKEEGFHYCFKHYSRWEKIEDEKFHELRNKYLDSAKELEQYINDKCKEIEK